MKNWTRRNVASTWIAAAIIAQQNNKALAEQVPVPNSNSSGTTGAEFHLQEKVRLQIDYPRQIAWSPDGSLLAVNRPCRLEIVSVRTYNPGMGRPSFREKIVASGMQTAHERGFATTGLREITAAAGVAQGSFTHHFSSKEEFGIAILDHYFDAIRSVIKGTLENSERKPIERLRAYFDAITELFATSGWRFGCLAGNMSLEASEHSEPIRRKLIEIFAEWTLAFAEAIRRAQATGDLAAGIDADEAGAALLEAWHGAMLRMKVERTSVPLDRFKRLIFPAVLGVAAP